MKSKKPRYPTISKKVITTISAKRILTCNALQVVAKELKSKGWKSLGTGAFSIVLQNPRYPKWALKIYADRAYHSYYTKLAMKSDNPHYPRGLKPKNLTDKQNPCRMVWLEKLSRNYNKANSVIVAYEYSSHRLHDTYPRLKEAFDKIKGLNHYTDISDNNIMYRKGIPVITDPVV